MADNLKEIFEEAGEFAEAYELGLGCSSHLLATLLINI